MQIIGVIFNVFFLFILVIMMLFGFISGMWKKLRSFGGLLIGVLLLIILINPIAKGLVNANLPMIDKSISDVVVELISSEMANGAAITQDGELALLCSSIAMVVTKIVVLFVGMMVVFTVIVPLNLIIARIAAGRDKHEKNIGIRFAGAGIAAAEVLIGFFLVTLPIFGATSLVMSYEDVLRANEETAEIVNVVEVIDNVIPNKITKIFGKQAPVKALGSFTKVKNKNGTINIFKEVYNAKPIVKIIIETNSKYEGQFLAAAIDNKEELVHFIKETNILETFMPAVLEILEASDSLEGIDINELKKIDLANDKEYLADMISVLLDFIEDAEVDLENPQAILGNENLPNALKELGDALKDTSFVDILLGFLQNILDEALTTETDLGALIEILDVTKIENENLGNDLYQIGIIANSINNTGILEGEIDLLSNTEELKKLIGAVLEFSLVKGNEEAIVDMLLEMTDLKGAFSELGIELNYENVNWSEEKDNLINIIDAYINVENNIDSFNIGNFAEYLKNDNQRKFIIDLINALAKSKLIGEGFITEVIDGVISGSSLDINLSKFDYNKIESWEQEINAIIELMDLLVGDLNLSEMSKNELEELILVATGPADQPCYLTSYIFGSIVNESLKDILSDEEFQNFESTHDLTNPVVLRESIQDIVTLIELTNKLNSEQNVEEWTTEEIEDFCNNFASMDLENSEVTATIIQAVVNQTGANVTKEEVLSADLVKEAESLKDILTAIQTDQSEEKIDELIQKAEEEDAVIILAIIESFLNK